MTSVDASEHELPRAYLRSVLLVLIGEGPTHGYELLEAVRAFGIRLTDPGSLYRALRSMEHDELVESWWQDSSSGPPRRTYVLTETGRAGLVVEMQSIRQRIELLSRLLDHADALDSVHR